MSGEKTFSRQHELPSLPVPTLEATAAAYLKSLRPFLSGTELRESEAAVREFVTGEGPRLQRLLEAKAAKERNWLTKWWEDEAYLRLRVPLLPYFNFGGASHDWQAWPAEEGSQLRRAAATCHVAAGYWLSVRRQTVPVMRSRSQVWDMNQTHRMFNSYRRPGREKDEILLHFATEDEGPAPAFLVVLCRGHLWRLPLLGQDGDAASASQFHAAFAEIRRRSAQTRSDYVGLMTAFPRTRWAEEREHLLGLHSDNVASIKAMEEAAFMVTLTDDSPDDDTGLARSAIIGNPRHAWADKCLNYHFHANGTVNSSSEHSIVDAIAMVQMCATTDAQLAAASWAIPIKPLLPSQELSISPLRFHTDARIRSACAEAEAFANGNSAGIDVAIDHFRGFGQRWCRERRVYGDTLVQLAIQLAHIRCHGAPAPAYETASTRKFFHGRTETVRSATEESVAFARAVVGGASEAEQARALQAAMKAQDFLMAEATEGRGIDRHLLGLRVLASKEGWEPRLFRDKGWKAAGGDGNFRLSTSFTGYSGVWGGVVPMCSQGYGVFYLMGKNKITFTTAAYLGAEERTDRLALQKNIWWALNHIQSLLASIAASANAAKL